MVEASLSKLDDKGIFTIIIVENESNYKNWINEQETFSDLIAKQENDKLKTTLIAKNND